MFKKELRRPVLEAVQTWDFTQVQRLLQCRDAEQAKKVEDESGQLLVAREKLGKGVPLLNSLKYSSGNLGDPSLWGGHFLTNLPKRVSDRVVGLDCGNKYNRISDQ